MPIKHNHITYLHSQGICNGEYITLIKDKSFPCLFFDSMYMRHLLVMFMVKRTFPAVFYMTAAVLSGFSIFTEIFQYRINAALKFLIIAPNQVSYVFISTHFAQFFKLGVQIKYKSRVRCLASHSRARRMQTNYIKGMT